MGIQGNDPAAHAWGLQATADRQTYSGRVRGLCNSLSVSSRAERLIDGRYEVLDRVGFKAALHR